MDEQDQSDRRNFKHLWMTEKGKVDPDTGEPRDFWTKIGVAYENRDGSFSLYLKAFPVDGRVVMQDPWPRERSQDGGRVQKLGVAA